MSVGHVSIIVLCVCVRLVRVEEVQQPGIEIEGSSLVNGGHDLLFSGEGFIDDFAGLFDVDVRRFVSSPPIGELFAIVSGLCVRWGVHYLL